MQIALALSGGRAHVAAHSELPANSSGRFRASLEAGLPGRRDDLKPESGEQSGAAVSIEAMAMSFTNTASVEQSIELEGTIQTVLPGTMFRVMLDNQHQVLAHISGKMRRHFVRLTVGDRVRMEMSPYDLSKARITYRLR
jgi:translation initiation factor IF-1